VFGFEMEGVIGGWRHVHNEELYDWGEDSI
jgi:hypothetical protein